MVIIQYLEKREEVKNFFKFSQSFYYSNKTALNILVYNLLVVLQSYFNSAIILCY